ncbi:MAG TPA: DinB family protein [Bacteroidia bacterium]|nr:DinB family protein [Bacteroidia bacterium]
MAINQGLIMEFKHEAENTRKMLKRVPADKYTWKPHDKSMELLKLARHIAGLPIWTGRAINATEYDFAKNPPAPGKPAESVAEVEEILNKNVEEAIKHLEGASDEHLMRPWTLRMGEKVFFTLPTVAVVRDFSISHTIHHRGQLSVYLRLLNIPVPGMYGPSADESM